MTKVNNHGQEVSQQRHIRNELRYEEKHGHKKHGKNHKADVVETKPADTKPVNTVETKPIEKPVVQPLEKPAEQPVVGLVESVQKLDQLQNELVPTINNFNETGHTTPQLNPVPLGDKFVPGITDFTKTGYTNPPLNPAILGDQLVPGIIDFTETGYTA